MKKRLLFQILCAAALFAAAPAGAQDGLRKSITWSYIRSHAAPLPVIGEVEAVHSVLDKPSRWSIGVETMDRDFALYDKFKGYVGETGAGYARLQSGWAKTEKKKGKYNFAWLDEHVDGLIQEGLRPWMCLSYGNPLYSQHGADLNAKLFLDGPVMDAWLRYVRATVLHFKGRISMWEVWNEPDGRMNLDSYPLYANLFVRTARLIRELDPDAKIAAFGSCSPDRPYIRQAMALIAEAGGLDLIDYITVHAYWPIPEKIVPAVKELRADIDAYSKSIGLLQGETGCPSQLEYGHAMHSMSWDEYSQVKWDLRQMMNFWSLGIPYSVFTMVDLQYTNYMLQSFGLIRMNLNKEPIYKRPKFYAVQHVTSLFTPELEPDTSIKACYGDSREVECVGVSKGGKAVGCVLWFGGARPTSNQERSYLDVSIDGIEFNEPVYIDLLTGYIHSLEKIAVKRNDHSHGFTTFSGLPLWDCPVLVIEKSAL